MFKAIIVLTMSINLMSDVIQFNSNSNSNIRLNEYPKLGMCTMEYNPICGKLKNNERTFSNKCMMKQTLYKFLHKGKCKKEELNKISN